MNIWDYEYEENVKITAVDDQVFIGTVINIEYADESESGENVVDIETDHGIFGILESEIKEIGHVKENEDSDTQGKSSGDEYSHSYL